MVRTVVCGYMIRFPLAGVMLAYFHYVLGLKRLGHEVVYIETSGWPQSCFDPEAGIWGDDPKIGLRLTRELFTDNGLDVSVLYILDAAKRIVLGGDWDGIRDAIARADVVLNLGGVNDLPEFDYCRRRVLVDMDPFFTQVGRFGHAQLERFTTCFSYGLNIGRPDCKVPTLGIEWIPTPPPVVVDNWELPPPAPRDPFSTVASWSAYGEVEHNGASYGQKDREFMRLLDLPARTQEPLLLALSGASEEVRTLLERRGWRTCDAARHVTRSPARYRDFIARSRGEFSVAKHAYVATRSGWFSDRTVCYLASGRPAVLQDTGFPDWLPTGNGVVAFSTIDEAADGLDRVSCNYTYHAAEARYLAREYFRYEVVLQHLLERALS